MRAVADELREALGIAPTARDVALVLALTGPAYGLVRLAIWLVLVIAGEAV